MKKQLTMLTVLATVIALGAYWGLSTLQISASETAVVQEAPQVAPMKTTDALVEVWKDRPIEELESYLAHIPNEVPVIAYPDEVGGNQRNVRGIRLAWRISWRVTSRRWKFGVSRFSF